MRAYERVGNGWSTNRYWAMRHGTSRAMEQDVIASSLQLNEQGYDASGYGLTEQGEAEVVASVERAKLPPETLVFYSPLARTYETAIIVRSKLGAGVLHCALELTERDFGELDGRTTDNYQSVWERDRLDGASEYMGVEPADIVATRGLALVRQLDEEHQNADILLVSHGDVLQILEAVRRGRKAGEHRALFPLAPGEIRRI